MDDPRPDLSPEAALPAPAAPSGEPLVPLWLWWWAANMTPLGLVPVVANQLRSHLGWASLAAVTYPLTVATLSLAQGLVLDRRVAKPVLWMAATTVGMLLAGCAGILVVGFLDGKLPNELALVVCAHALGGAVLAAAQALVLR